MSGAESAYADGGAGTGMRAWCEEGCCKKYWALEVKDAVGIMSMYR